MATRQENVIQDYEKLWEEWRLTGDLKATIEDHLSTRGEFFGVLDEVVSHLGDGARVVELGCGTAIDIGVLSRKHPAKAFMATDLSLNAAKLARDVSASFGNGFGVFAGDIQHLPLERESVDVVFSQGVMEHFRDPVPFFKEQIDVLKAGGYLIVSVPQKFTGYTLHKHALIKKGQWKLGWETEFSYRRLRKVVCGLGLIEERHLGEGYWKSWKEPAFVLSDIVNKIYRFSPIRLGGPMLIPSKAYHALFRMMERLSGHLFMKNLIVIFRKPNMD